MASSPAKPPPSSSSESQSPPQTATQVATDQYNNTNPLIHTIALGVTPLALLALALPPRRLDLRAVTLGGVAIWGTNQLTHDYSGKSFAQRFSSRMAGMTGVELPEKAKATQARLREERERRERLRALREEMTRSGAVTAKGEGLEGWSDEQKRALFEAYQKERREGTPTRQDGGKAEKGFLERIWMGDAESDWKEKREKREREALQEGGGGYWGLITEQIAEVWNGGRKNEGDEKTSGDGKER